MLLRPIRFVAALAGFLCIAAAAPSAGQLSEYIEDFTTTTYMDTAATTALWDVVDEEISLHPYAIELVGSCASSGNCRSATRHGDYVFLFASGGGIDIVDISDLTSPSVVGNYNSAGYSYQGVVAGDYLYVADDTGGLAILDITDPTAPSDLSVYPTPGKVRGVAVAGDLAYVADHTGGFFSLDVEDPSAPELRHTITPPGYPQDVDLSGNVAYVASWDAGVLAINIRNSTSMPVLGTYDTPGLAVAVDVQGDLLYVADDGGGFLILDISDPTSPSLLSSTSTPDNAHSVTVAGDYAYVTCDDAGVLVFDVTDPAVPVLLTTHDTPGHAFHLDLAGQHAFLADRDGGFRILKVCELFGPELVGSTASEPHGPSDLVLAGNTVYVTGAGVGLESWDVSDPLVPVRLHLRDYAASGAALDLSGNVLYVTSTDVAYGHRPWCFDVTDPADPVYSGDGDYLPGYCKDVLVDGDSFFVTYAFTDSLPYVEMLGTGTVGNPLVPRVWTSEEGPDVTADLPSCVIASGDLAYMIVEDAIASFDVSTIMWGADKLDEHRVTTYIHEGRELGVDGDLLFCLIGCGTPGLLVVDVQAPAALNPLFEFPFLLWDITGTTDLAGALVVDGEVVFVGWDGLCVLDVSDPSSPASVSSVGLELGTGLHSMALLGDYIIAVQGDEVTGSELATYQVYQRRVDMTRVVVQSTDIEPDGETLLRARITTVQSGAVDWSLSPDGGVTWYAVLPDSSWVEFDSGTGSELLWRAEFDYVGSVEPSCSSLWVEYEVENTGIGDELPARFALRQNTPNPFNPVTTIAYDVPAPGGRVTIAIYDVAGRLVRTLVDSSQEPGRLAAVWDGTDETGAMVGSGVYYCRMQSDDHDETIKLTLLK